MRCSLSASSCLPNQSDFSKDIPPQISAVTEICEYMYILRALAKIHSGTQKRSKRTRGDSTYAAGYWLPSVRHQALHSDRILCYALYYVI